MGWTAPLGGEPEAAGSAGAAPVRATAQASGVATAQASEVATAEQLDERLERVAAGWRARLDRVELTLPASSQPVADTLRTALAQILMSRDGPALRPGTRAYSRSWIRDGAMMVAGLVRASFQTASGFQLSASCGTAVPRSRTRTRAALPASARAIVPPPRRSR